MGSKINLQTFAGLFTDIQNLMLVGFSTARKWKWEDASLTVTQGTDVLHFSSTGISMFCSYIQLAKAN